MSWQPTAEVYALHQRAEVCHAIRRFFADRQVLEVDTPAMSQATVTDIHLHSFATEFVGPGAASGQKLSLVTSPEYHMKRLLCAGAGSIYQLNKCFRNEEAGCHHNPEFTMLEWYRVDFDHHALMDEVDELLQTTLGCDEADRLTYQQIFERVLGVDPLTATLDQLKSVAPVSLVDLLKLETDRDTTLQFLFAEAVEPAIESSEVPCFVFNFPASQAALARICPKDPRVSERFEVYFGGLELANGFHELTDADEQLARFEKDNDKRKEMGLPPVPIDMRLIDALQSGLPDCAGVALGLDRLVMLKLGASSIHEVIAFPLRRA